MEHLGALVELVVRYMEDAFDIYDVSNDAEEKLWSKYFGRVAVSYRPPLVLDVGPPAY